MFPKSCREVQILRRMRGGKKYFENSSQAFKNALIYNIFDNMSPIYFLTQSLYEPIIALPNAAFFLLSIKQQTQK